MCGIVGYTGVSNASDFLLDGLERLEYRGYDSAGIALVGDGELCVVKSAGRIQFLREKISSLNGTAPGGYLGIGHTRWATHGAPTEYNAHPHTDCSGKLAVVHNGIIENYLRLRHNLEKQGHIFYSQTDTEVIPHLIEHYYDGDLAAAVRRAVADLQGSYALAVISLNDPGLLVAARQDSPLVIGLGREEYLLASDLPAIVGRTRDAYIMDDGEVACLRPDGVRVSDLRGCQRDKGVFHITWDGAAAEKSGYAHFMLKEIHEQPRAIKDTLRGRLDLAAGRVELPELEPLLAGLPKLGRIAIAACGTAYHAGLVGKYVLEKVLGLPVEVDLASEFRYRNPCLDPSTLVMVISQSGETADTLAAMREAKNKRARVLAITNVVGSSVAREADAVFYTQAGPEIAVASTKAYSTQLVAIYLVALYLAQRLQVACQTDWHQILASLAELPEIVQETLKLEPEVRKYAEAIAVKKDIFYIGRGLDYAVALEGALKLKEISYLHAEAYAAGELKHGTLALIEEGVPVIALVTQPALRDKMASNIKEIKARDGYVLALQVPGMDETGSPEESGDLDLKAVADDVLQLPPVIPLLAPVVTAIPLQLLAYYAAVTRGCPVDKPRNLAKSVTVE